LNDLEVVSVGCSAEGRITRFGEGIWRAEFDSPNTLSGVTLDFAEGNVTASYKGLSFSVPQSALPVKAMMLELIEAVDSCAKLEELSGKEEDGALLIGGNLEAGEYTLSVDGEGSISAFEMPGSKLKIVFSEVTAIEGALPEEATETASEESLPSPTEEETDGQER
ncbi:MAG TPA: hypothetical protein PLY43_09825, partial [Ruminococcus sp.]|nr:hypothetical protein [Ruminococcus sp.]